MENKSKTVVIVGGAGRLGSAFTKECKKNGYKVFVIDICTKEEWKKIGVNSDFFSQTNINEPDSMSNTINYIS